MKIRWISIFLFMLIFIKIAYAAGPISTGKMLPISLDICGTFGDNVQITVENIVSSKNLTDVEAVLRIEPANIDLIIIPNKVDLGDLIESIKSLENPSWVLYCKQRTKPGKYTVYIDYIDSNGCVASSLNEAESKITVHSSDTVPPQIESHSPSGRVTNPHTILSITTNEKATCKYSSTENMPYNMMEETFSSITGKTNHISYLTDLDQKEYQFYVKCKDGQGNMATEDYIIHFLIDLPPTAQIKLDSQTPIKAGTISVTLTTSEEVQQTPSLIFTLDGEEEIFIPLTGTGRTWTGIMIIDEPDINKVGYFKFLGTDLTGNNGDIITSGKIFLVDTKKPSSTTSINAISKKSGSIRLKWYYDEEDIFYFKIYRSTTEDVNYLDFYEKIDISPFTDSDVNPGETYYYKVTAVDKAGNEGQLSREVHATGLIKTIETEEKVLPIELVGEVDSLIMKVNQIISEAEIALIDLKREKKIAEDLNLIEKSNNAKSELVDLEKVLGNLKTQDLTQVELSKKLSRITLELKIIKKKIAENIIINKETDFSQNLGLDDIESVIKEAYPEVTDKFIADNKELQDFLSVRTKMKEIIVSYLDGSEKYYTLIEEQVSIDGIDNINNLELIESIPKSVIEDANDIDFKTSSYDILKRDPIVKWSINSDSKKIRYILNKKIYPDDAKKIKLVIINLGDKIEDIQKEKNKITGYASFKSISKIFENFRIVFFLIIGLSIYYFILKRRNGYNIRYKPSKTKKHHTKIKNIKKLKKNYIKKTIKKIGIAKLVSAFNDWLRIPK